MELPHADVASPPPADERPSGQSPERDLICDLLLKAAEREVLIDEQAAALAKRASGAGAPAGARSRLRWPGDAPVEAVHVAAAALFVCTFLV